MDRTQIPAAAEKLLQRIGAALWAIAIARVDTRLAAELAEIQTELIAQAQEYRSQQSELGEALAVRLEDAAERVARDWISTEQSKGSAPHAGASSRRRTASGSLELSGEQSAARRPRGRPRKAVPSDELAEPMHDASAVQHIKEEPVA
jgi:hypothetical protein